MDTKGIIETIRSGVSGIHIQSQDFFRVDEEISSIATQLRFKVLEWNMGYGWVDFQNKHSLNPDQDVSLFQDLKSLSDNDLTGRLYVIKNAYSVLKDDSRAVGRLQQELLRIKRYFNGNAAILLIAKDSINFSDISDLIVSFQCLPLASEQVEHIFQLFLKEQLISVSTEVKNALISICSGMERDMVFRLLQTLKNSYGDSFSKKALDDALTFKKRLLSQSGLLELIESKVNIAQIGGLEQLKNWLRNKKHIIDDLSGAERFGIKAPKGVLLVGMPGCGKSMSAKATASLFNVPLLRLDIGSLMGKFVGESEENMKSALKVAEKASPCVLWIDELEKAFSGVNGSGGSTEITTRLFGYFLTWMQEKPGAVFLVATANDITTIPPELLRRGRFDEIFYIDLPNNHERKQIFKVKTELLPHPHQGLCLNTLSEKTDGFSGADIECVINDALEEQFRRQQRTLTQVSLENHIQLITPISVVLEEKINNYRELFSKFSLKPASFSEMELKELESSSESYDVSERVNAASNEYLSQDKLMQLAKDDNANVRKAVLSNPNCPYDALKQIVEAYEPFNFSKSGSWCESEVTKEEFSLALQHPNMKGALIVGLYRSKLISPDKLCSLANRLSKQEQASVFSTAKIKLSQSIQSGTIRNICCSLKGVVKTHDTLFEIDNENSSTQQIVASSSGLVTEICIRLGAVIYSGDVLAKMLVPKLKD